MAASDAAHCNSELEPQQRVLMSLAKLESLTWLAEDTEVDQVAIAPLPKVRDDLAAGERTLNALELAKEKLQAL